MTKVLLVTQNLHLCGAQRQIVELALGLDHEAYDTRVACLDDEGPLKQELDRASIPVISFPRHWRWDLSVVSRLSRYLKHEEIDIVHSFLFLPNFYSRLAGRYSGTPVVISSLRSTGIEGSHRYLLDLWTSFLCDVIVANSEAGKQDYAKRWGPDSEIVVIRNGVDVDRFSPRDGEAADRKRLGLPESGTVLGMFAAMEQRKDQALLVRALAKVTGEEPGVHLLLVGGGSSRKRIDRLVTELGLASKTTILGETRNIECLYGHLDIYVQASRSEEGTSNSILKAMSCGLPVIATDVGGNKEIVLHRESGLIVPAGDVESLATSILSLLRDPATRSEMGQEGLQEVRRNYGRAKMVQETVHLYQNLLERS